MSTEQEAERPTLSIIIPALNEARNIGATLDAVKEVRCRVADAGFCAAKKSRFHGVRLHCIAQRRVSRLPLPSQVWLCAASHHDSKAFIEQHPERPSTELFGDLAYPTPQLISDLKKQQARLITPQKKPKGKELTLDEQYYNRLVRRIRQPIENLFNWIQEKTGIQRASKVRSTEALMIHCWGKRAVAFFLLAFNYWFASLSVLIM